MKNTTLSIVSGILLPVAGLVALAACDNLIYDDEGDCEASYTVSLVYDMNLEYADAFAHYVETVTLCAFGSDDVLAYTKTEDAGTIIENDQKMDVSDITPGTYTLVVWAEGEEETADCYECASLSVGSTTLDELTCRLARTSGSEGDAVIDHALTPLFNGYLEDADLTDIGYDGERNVEVDLTKDTNSLVVVLQHLSGEDVNVADFTFEVTDNNGLLDYDNSVIPDDELSYRPWTLSSGTASVTDDEESDAQTSVAVAVAEFALNRLVTTNDPRLTVYDTEGDIVLSIPLIDYATLVKSHYSGDITDQEYLDRQDEYSMTFFLDDNDRWVNTVIIINSWRIVMEDIDL